MIDFFGSRKSISQTGAAVSPAKAGNIYSISRFLLTIVFSPSFQGGVADIF